MLADISNVDAIYIVCGRTDMRKSIDGLCSIVEEQSFALGVRWICAVIRRELLFEIISWKVQKLRLSEKSSRIMMYHWTY